MGHLGLSTFNGSITLINDMESLKDQSTYFQTHKLFQKPPCIEMSATDYYAILESFLPTIDNLPSEIHFIFSEIRDFNDDMKRTQEEIREMDLQLKPTFDQMDQDGEGSQQSIYTKIQQSYKTLEQSSQKRIELITRARELLDKHLKSLESIMPEELLPVSQPSTNSVPKKKLLGGVQLYCVCQQVSYGEMIGCDSIVMLINTDLSI